MKRLLFRWMAVLSLSLAPGLLLAEPTAKPKPRQDYLVRPSTDTVKRRQDVLALGQSKQDQSAPKLLEALEDKDPMTRTLAIQGLGSLKYTAAGSKLAQLLESDPYMQVRQAAAVGLRQIDDPQAVDALAKALKDPEAGVRLVSLSGLAYYKNASSRKPVEGALKDKSAEVRRTAVFVLSRLDDSAAVPAIEPLLKDADGSVRAGAAQALGELRAAGSKAMLGPLLADPEKVVRASAARSLMMLKDSAGFGVAKTLARDPDLGVRAIAIDALGWSQDPSAESELQSLMTQAPADSRPAVQEALTRCQQLRKQ